MFTTQTYGKWILCGEQAVLRGHPAIVFPLLNYQLHLEFQPNHKPLVIHGVNPQHHHSILQLWNYAWDTILPHADPYQHQGQLTIQSNIPIGQGMGASAALCLAIARCVTHFHDHQQTLWEFARNLEHLFHGQSSGLDILAAGSHQAHWFQQGETRNINLNWQPYWILSPSHESSKTADAIQHVQQLWQQQPKFADDLDKKMAHSVNLALQALENKDESLLIQSMKLAQYCFQHWNLITPKMQKQIDELYQLGAKAVKPTGSGGGGYLLSLWDREHYQQFKNHQEFISIILPNGNMSHQV